MQARLSGWMKPSNLAFLAILSNFSSESFSVSARSASREFCSPEGTLVPLLLEFLLRPLEEDFLKLAHFQVIIDV
jgi:hypothetical protein